MPELNYWKLISLGISVLALFGALFYYGHTKYREGYDKAFSACEIQKQRTIDERQKTKDRQDSVPRPDDSDYINRLLRETA